MQFMLLVFEKPGDRRNRPADDGRAKYDRMLGFGQDLKSRGILKGGDALDTEAVRVETRDAKRSIVDGPFAETKEIVGGYFLIDCASREEAVAIAGKCPAAEWATVEVRGVGVCF